MIGLQELTSRKSLSWLEFADVIFGGTSDSRKYVCVRRLSNEGLAALFCYKISASHFDPFSVEISPAVFVAGCKVMIGHETGT